MNRVLKVACAAAATLAVVACTDYESSTDLNAEGPPMIQQVRLRETYTLANGTSTSTRTVFAFGTHENVLTEAEAHPVTTATAASNKIRVVIDELLVGNNLEEIACRAPVRANEAYSRLPLGATPDDVARCAGPQDILPSTCRGGKAVCLCEIETGCLVGDSMIAQGAPVGVLDINQDGAADDTRLIPGAVVLQCGSIQVPIDPDMSYWNPSGNQKVPAQGGFDALGPAIVLTPTRGLPANLECNLTFAEDVTDKEGFRLCAPINGDITQDCTPGDVTQFGFRVEPMTFSPASFPDMGTGVSRTTPLLVIANTTLDVATIGNVTLTSGAGNTPYTNFTVTQAATPAGRNIRINVAPGTDCMNCPAGGLPAATTFTLTVPTTVRDTFGQSAAAPAVFTFTTGN